MESYIPTGQGIVIPEEIPEEFAGHQSLSWAFAIAARTTELKKLEQPGQAPYIDRDFRVLTEAIKILITLDESNARMRNHIEQLCVVAFIDTATEFHYKTGSLRTKQWTHDIVTKTFPHLPFPGQYDNLIDYTSQQTLVWAPPSIQRVMAAKTVAEGTVLLKEIKDLPKPELEQLKKTAQAHAKTTPLGNLPESLRKKRDEALQAILALEPTHQEFS